MIVTHPHYDHAGGLSAVLESFGVGRAVFQNGDTNDSCDACVTFLKEARVDGPGLDVLRRGQTVVVGNPSGTLALSVLHPGVLSPNDIDNNSIVLMLSYGDVDFLFAGDAEGEAEAGMLAAGVVGEVEILKVGDHGSSSASSREFLDTCRAEVAIYMADGSSGYPHGDTGLALENA
jgi:beta-lactamase superfamily II metal-dependent hydrolase